MYAIVKSGGKQFRVETGDVIRVERLTAPVGDVVRLEDVLLVGGEGEAVIGAPRVAGSSVVGAVREGGRDRKLRIFKYKRRKHYRRTKGHRQSFSAVRIDSIQT